MADHTDFLELARELIADDGRQVTFIKLTDVVADNSKPWRGPGAPAILASVTTFAVFLPDGTLGTLGLGGGFGTFNTDDDLFKSSEEILLVAPPTTGENLTDFHLVVDGATATTDNARKINLSKELRPADLTVLYAMGVSR